VTADWLKLSAEDGKYLPEQPYEIVEWFPKGKVTRLMVQASPGVLPGAELLCSRHIYVGKTMFDSKLIKKLIEECGATVWPRDCIKKVKVSKQRLLILQFMNISIFFNSGVREC
jgi:hypothetical protein